MKAAFCLCAREASVRKHEENDGRSLIGLVYQFQCADHKCGLDINFGMVPKPEAIKLWNKHVQENADALVIQALQIISIPHGGLPIVVDAALRRSYDKAMNDYKRLITVLQSCEQE